MKARSHRFAFSALTIPVLLTVSGLATGAPSPRDLNQALQSVRTSLTLDNGTLSGPGAAILLPAIAEAQYVFVGEDHVTHEIPLFTAALCDAMALQGGLAAMAVEAGPEAGKLTAAALGHADGERRIAAHLVRYPDSIAFLNIRDELAMAVHCAHAAGPAFRLWGLDQEFLGSAGWLLDRIAAGHPGQQATPMLAALRAEERADAGRAAMTGDPSELFVFKAKDDVLAAAMAALKAGGDSGARSLFQSLIDTHRIYTEDGAISNADRARLLKRTLVGDIRSLPAGGARQRILLKFGDDHGFKALNPLNQRDLGNFVAELAEGGGSKSLHIDVLGAHGTHRLYAGYGKPTTLQPFVMTDDPDYRWLKPAIDNRADHAWTLYDLRPLRFHNYADLDPRMEREVYGYDFLLIIPEITPAQMIGAP